MSVMQSAFFHTELLKADHAMCLHIHLSNPIPERT